MRRLSCHLSRPLAAVLLLWACAACAADLKVLTAGAFKPVLLALQPDFERRSGHHLAIQNDTAGGVQRRIAAGEAFDFVASSPASLQPLLDSGKLAAAPVPLARVGIGVAVAPGRPLPDISSVAAFKDLMIGARAVAYTDPASGGTAGVYLSKLFERLGVADQVRAKAVLVPGGLSAERVVNGQADVALQPMSELLAVKGAVPVGLLPPEIQLYIVYAGAIPAGSASPSAARELLEALQSEATTRLLPGKGMERP